MTGGPATKPPFSTSKRLPRSDGRSNMADEAITIKGIREGLLLTIKPDGGDWSELAVKIAERIDEQREFFKGARVALDVGTRPVLQLEMDRLKAAPANRNMILSARRRACAATTHRAKNRGPRTTLTP